MLESCKHLEEKKEEISDSSETITQGIYEHNVFVVQSVDGYTQPQAESLAHLLQYLVKNGHIPNGEISSAEEFVSQKVDNNGELFEAVYLHFNTEDGQDYYALILKNNDIYVIYKGPIENNEYVWAVVE